MERPAHAASAGCRSRTSTACQDGGGEGALVLRLYRESTSAP
jgi:hypothetical protein